MKYASDIKGYDKLLNKIGDDIHEQATKILQEKDFWESI